MATVVVEVTVRLHPELTLTVRHEQLSGVTPALNKAQVVALTEQCAVTGQALLSSQGEKL